MAVRCIRPRRPGRHRPPAWYPQRRHELQEAGEYEVYGAGGLFLPVERSLASLQTAQDRCVVNDEFTPLPDEAFKTLLDASESITIRAGTEPFLPLSRVTFAGGGFGYTAGKFLESIPFPSATFTVEIPGGAFPAMTGAFPTVPGPAVNSPSEPVVLSAENHFTWEPYRVEGVVSYLDFQVLNRDYETKPYVLVDCIAADDGEFSFPSEVRQAILTLDPTFEGEVSTPSRTVYRLVKRGGGSLLGPLVIGE